MSPEAFPDLGSARKELFRVYEIHAGLFQALECPTVVCRYAGCLRVRWRNQSEYVIDHTTFHHIVLTLVLGDLELPFAPTDFLAEPLGDGVDALSDLVDHVVVNYLARLHGVDPERHFLAGLLFFFLCLSSSVLRNNDIVSEPNHGHIYRQRSVLLHEFCKTHESGNICLHKFLATRLLFAHVLASIYNLVTSAVFSQRKNVRVYLLGVLLVARCVVFV